MLDFVRVGIRTAVITAIFLALGVLLAGLFKLFSIIPFPDVSLVTDAFSIAFWFLHRFAPPLVWTILFISSLIVFKFTVYVAYLVNLAASWVLEIFK